MDELPPHSRMVVTSEAKSLQCRLRIMREAGPETVRQWTLAPHGECQVMIGGGTWLEVAEAPH